ncbi:MAG: ABC transporter ATP-binding protein [Myxococcales bacterium]|nr:ABC transporter ATP-binding protein [Myxococcales bacterium]
MSAPAASVIVDGVSKSYAAGKVPAVVDLSFTVARGELFGLIGPDGAGKTTLLRILTTLVLADRGTASVEGHDVVRDFKAIRRIVGYMPGRFSLYQDLSVAENLAFFATVFGTTVDANYHLIADIYTQLEPFKTRLAGKLSGGMKQKLALCCALIHEPKVLFLDEPTTGVDPVSRKEFWDMLGRLRDRGITIVVSTPYMDEAARCDRIALVQHGEIIALDTLAALLAGHAVATYAVRGPQPFRLLQDLRAYARTEYCYAFGQEQHLVLTAADVAGVDGVRAHLRAAGHGEVSIRPIAPNIEDVFIHLTHERAHA